jgi:hypothetical protein
MIICRLKGGLGNQLFCYAAARRVARYNNTELVLDTVSGFERDHLYQRSYALQNFSITSRLATSQERLEPFERYRRGFAKLRARRRPFCQRRYLEQEGLNFDGRLLKLKINHDLYLDGLWQSENYFKDIEDELRRDLTILSPTVSENLKIAWLISQCQTPVALHVRWFDSPEAGAEKNNVYVEYYKNALAYIQAKVVNPHFFLFSDNPVAAARSLSLNADIYTVVAHNQMDSDAYADLWLMSQCKHFITANSTFSWWGAWLGEKKNTIVVVPDPGMLRRGSGWRAKGLIPERWSRL